MQLSAAAETEFERGFGRPSRWLAAAPGRVNLIGEHTDYNQGFVLPMAIDRYVVVAAARLQGQGSTTSRVFSTSFQEWAEIPMETAPARHLPPWAAYVQGVIAGFMQAGIPVAPFEAVVHANLPLGGGLSSSAALEVAFGTLLEALTGTRLEPLQMALLCQKAEHDFAGVPCGIMDQCASVMGRANCLLLIDCRTLEVRWTALADPELVALIVNTNVKHELGTSEYAVRRQQCQRAASLLGVAALRDATMEKLEEQREHLGELLYRRARHVITENERTLAAADAVPKGEWAKLGQLMAASHASLRDDYEVSCPELDTLVELANELGPDHGVIGSRMTGGGFGGCTITLARRAAVNEIASHLTEQYLKKTRCNASVFTVSAVEGAHLL
jgi:galactokinase